MTNLNTELLFFDIMHKEGEALLPHRVFRCINNLWTEKTVTGKKLLCCVFCDSNIFTTQTIRKETFQFDSYRPALLYGAKIQQNKYKY